MPPQLATAAARGAVEMRTPIPPWMMGYFGARWAIRKLGSLMRSPFRELLETDTAKQGRLAQGCIIPQAGSRTQRELPLADTQFMVELLCSGGIGGCVWRG